MGDVRLNFDVLRDMGLTAVRCYNPEQARVLLDEMFRQYPKLVEKYWFDRDPRWEEYQPDTTYALHIFDKKIDTMQIADEAYWKSHSYKIVNFSDLIYKAVDYGEIKLFENSISSLFGLEE